jgi:hypothetical protein
MGLIKRFKDYFNTKDIKLDEMEVGDVISFKDTKELAPFNLKLVSRGKGGYDPISQATSDLPNLKGMIFEYDYDANTIKRVK